MKLIIKILIVLTLILAIAYGAAYVFVAKKGKDLIVKQIEGAVNKKVTIDYVRLIPPFNLEISGLKIKDLIKADSIFVVPGVTSLFTGSVVLDEIKITRPEFKYEKQLVLLKDEATAEAVKGLVLPKTENTAQAQQLRILLKHLKVVNGIVEIVDHIGERTVRLAISKINVDLDNLYLFPNSAITDFDVRGEIPWSDGKGAGKVEILGWINLVKKDIQATFKIQDIDAINLYPYYSTWVDLEKARIDKAKLNFVSNIQGHNNDVNAGCHLELSEIVFRPRTSEEPQEKAERIAFAVIDIFKTANGGKVFIDFNIKTKMDKPKFSFTDIRMAFESKLMKARENDGFKPETFLLLPGKLIQSTVKGATDLTKGVINGTINAGKDIKDAFGSTPKKDPEPTAIIYSNQPATEAVPEGVVK